MRDRARSVFTPHSLAFLCLSSCMMLVAPAYGQGCTTEELELSAVVRATLTPQDCGYKDLIPDSKQGLNVKGYVLTVRERGILTIDMAGAFDPNVYLFDKSFYRYAPDAQNPQVVQGVQLTISLTAGRYLLLATSASPQQFGEFTLSTSWAQPPNCAIEDIPAGGVISSELSALDCRILDMTAPSTDLERTKRFRITPSTTGVWGIGLSSKTFLTDMEVRDGQNVAVAGGEPDAETMETSLTVSLKAEPYVIYVSSNSPDLGAFTLTSKMEPLRDCAKQALRIGETATGSLATGACRYLDVVVPSADLSLVTPYSLKVDSTSLVSIDMKSGEFDTYLDLIDATGKEIESDDDGGEGTDSRALSSLNPGVYTVLASTANYGSGAYSLAASSSPLRPCGSKELNPGDEDWSTVGLNSCRVLDVVIPSSDLTNVESYKIPLVQRTALSLSMLSFETTPTVELYDANLRLVAKATGDAAGSSPVMSTLLPAGTYRALVGLADDASGWFRLSASGKAPRVCATEALKINTAAAGQFSAQDCAGRDILIGSTSNAPAKQYKLTLPGAGSLNFSITSSDTTVVMTLLNSREEVVGSAVGRGIPGRIAMPAMAAGDYTVIVMPASGSDGSFFVQPDFAPEGK